MSSRSLTRFPRVFLLAPRCEPEEGLRYFNSAPFEQGDVLPRSTRQVPSGAEKRIVVTRPLIPNLPPSSEIRSARTSASSGTSPTTNGECVFTTTCRIHNLVVKAATT